MNKILQLLGFIFWAFGVFRSRCCGLYWQEKIRLGAKSYGSIRVNGDVSMFGIDAIQVGDNVHLGQGAFIMGDGGLKIGDNTHISRNLTLYTRNHDYNGKRLPYDDAHIYRSVNIGRNVWIGMNVTILPGAVIGDGAIVGAGAVVYGVVERCSIIGMTGSKEVSKRDFAHYEELDRLRKYGGVNGREA